MICEYVPMKNKTHKIKTGHSTITVTENFGGKPRGVVVAVGKGKVGYCYVADDDFWRIYQGKVTKKDLVKKAIIRAKNGAKLDNAPAEIKPIIQKMIERSERYFE